MRAQTATSRYSAWADLDAIVLQEVDALSGRSARPPIADFASNDDFVARVSTYLRGHDEAEALVKRLCKHLGLFRRPEVEETSDVELQPESTGQDPDAAPAPPPPPSATSGEGGGET
jgi:hypothetical protein